MKEVWKKGAVMWLVPIRFWEDEYKPVRCVIVEDRGTRRRGDSSIYAFHSGYAHNVYLDPFDLYPTRKACKAEIARRRQMRVKEDDLDDARMMKDVRAGKYSLNAMRRALMAAWKRGDARPPNRFYDRGRFKKKNK